MKNILVLIFSVVVSFSILSFQNVNLFKSSFNPSISIGNKKSFIVEVARTQDQREKGLMFRKKLPADTGMLFIFTDTTTHPFWNKNTYIPLDVVWIDHDVIVDIQSMPKFGNLVTLTPTSPSNMVLELPAGTVQKHHIKVGDSTIEYNLK